MGKYTDRRKEVHIEKDHTKSLAWRGIGCVLMIIIPLLSFAAASITMNHPSASLYLPEALFIAPVMPASVYKLPVETQNLFMWVTAYPTFYGLVMFTLVYMVVLGSIISFVYALVFRAVGPKTTNPFDVARPNTRAKKYKR